MARKKGEELNIVEVRKKSRNLGMSRGRVTRNMQVDKVCNIRCFHLAIIQQEASKAKKQSDFVKLLFSKL